MTPKLTDRPIPTLLVVLVCLLAGCAGFGGSEPFDREPYSVEYTVAPGELADDRSGSLELGANDVVPGITEEGVRNPFHAGDTHLYYLSGSPFTAVIDERGRDSNGTVLYHTRMVTSFASSTYTYHAIQTHDGTDEYGGSYTTERWVEGGRPYERHVSAGGRVEYRAQPSDVNQREDFSGRTTIVDGLRFATVSIVDQYEQDGERLYVFESPEPAPMELYRTSNLSVRLVITEEGFIQRYEERYEVQEAGEVLTVTRTITYEEVGTATVEEPSWVDVARNADGLTVETVTLTEQP